jgi:nitrous oxide reductase accessory protein NosL
MTRRLTIPLLSILVLTLGGCARKALTPEPLPVDRVECARCRMLISNERGAAQIVSPSDETRYYDDVGCLAGGWTARHEGARAFVRVEADWLDARVASFAQPAGAQTAMGSGIVAFRTPEAAARADRSGRALTFDDIVRTAAGE